MITPPDVPEGTGLWATGASAIGFFLWLRKKLSKDKVDVAKDAAEVNILSRWREERDQAIDELKQALERERAVWKARTADAQLIGELTAQVKHQSSLIEAMERQIVSLRGDLHILRDVLASMKTTDVVDRLRERGIDLDDIGKDAGHAGH